MSLFWPKGEVDCFTMFDEDASITILEEDTTKRIGLKGSQQQLKLQWYGDQVHLEKSFNVNLEISEVNDYRK